MRSFFAAVALAAVAGSAMAAPAPAGWLVLKGKTSVDHVLIAGTVWNCKSNACTAHQVKDASALETCKALAAKVGAVARFGFKGAELNLDKSMKQLIA